MDRLQLSHEHTINLDFEVCKCILKCVCELSFILSQVQHLAVSVLLSPSNTSAGILDNSKGALDPRVCT